MRIFFLLIVLVHGLIHFMGFAKAFGLYEFKQISQPISKSLGIIWLLAFVLFAATLIFFVFKNNYWWLWGVLAVIISQVLIINTWSDAKYGTLANIIILLAAVIAYGTWDYHNKYIKEVKANLQTEENLPQSILTENDIQHLPEPVKKYIRYTGFMGKPKVNNFKIEFSGKLRKNENSEWMSFTSEQYNFMKTPTRLFFMKAVMKNLPVAGFHCFKNGNAFMDIRLLSLFKVQYMDGKEMDVAETVTFFNDMCCMAPATLIDKRINWLETDGNMIKASFTNNNITIFARLFFNDTGELINFISDDRYSADAGKKIPWSTPLRNYKEINGHTLTGYAETIYSYPDRDLCYGTFNIDKIEYNCKSVK